MPALSEDFLPPDLSVALPEGTNPDEAASYYRKKATFFETQAKSAEAEAKNAEAEAKKSKLEARQAWLWWAGIAGVVLGVAAFALAFAYPLASFLRIGGVAGVASGGAMLLLGEALPYLGWFALLTVAAIVASLFLNTRVLATLTQSWKSASESLAPVLRTGLDETSLKRQCALVRPFIDKLLKKV
jgi:hypothetical protein